MTTAEFNCEELVSKEDLEMVYLVMVCNFTVRQVAEHKGISLEAAKTRFRRARTRLTRALERPEAEEIG